ncbi:class IV adenylate cyclase [Pontibacter sp. KCTC 32443]|uniref:class IV adenylate cyclase n=1 Tax=Pontibacter TaxID=323449 RepID=UPI00164D8D72|nr:MULTISPECIES: class IV adenylate cyclase [Pontibacter]MBC5773230.1 class IV adenylate cyclase [Pontibacter sp. KCTC 32443]
MYADITIKARCYDPAKVESILLEHEAEYVGLDVQTDTYYETDYGKLKHRQGTIENVLIHYNRKINGEATQTEVMLYLKNPGVETIDQICGNQRLLAQVKKLRKIYFIENVKFHIDYLEELGHFVEIEAIDLDGSLGIDLLNQQCRYYKELLQIEEDDLITSAYTDLIHHNS